MSSVSTFGAFTMAKLGIYASQKAMQVTGNNITNVNTVGYTRQQLDLQSLYIGGADRYSSKWDMKVGSGVISTGVSQIRSPYLDIRYRVEQSNVGMIEKKLEGLNELSRIFDEVGDGTHDEGVMEAALQGLIEQLEYYSSEGAGKEEFDTIVKGMSKELVSIFNDYARRLEKEYDTKVSEFKQDVTKVNTILDGIRKLNNSIRKAEIHGSNALELKDERNLLIDELSKYVRIDVIYEEEDVGAGYMVDKLVIKLDGNDPKSGNDGATLIDGKYATQLRVDDFLKDDGAIAGSNFDVTLETLRDITGRAKTLNGY
ncbi:MAG: flagellar hook-associated protein FlgK, partial [Clostridiaceae bacterium]|nr:flagellar hook-associated protein FlgK [Clostridiaceae bacterium]